MNEAVIAKAAEESTFMRKPHSPVEDMVISSMNDAATVTARAAMGPKTKPATAMITSLGSYLRNSTEVIGMRNRHTAANARAVRTASAVSFLSLILFSDIVNSDPPPEAAIKCAAEICFAHGTAYPEAAEPDFTAHRFTVRGVPQSGGGATCLSEKCAAGRKRPALPVQAKPSPV